MEEQQEVQEPTPIEEQLSTENSRPTKLNKNGKPRKQMTPEALERLAKAREKANSIRQQAYAKKLEEKVEKIKGKTEEQQKLLPPIADEEETQKPVSAPSQGVIGEEVPYEEPEKEIKVKEKKSIKQKKKTKIIVEQSSEDSDEFEPNDSVLFVKRVSRKKKPIEEPIVREPEQQQMSLPPPKSPPKRPPDLTPQQRLLKSQYESMFSGSFLNNGNMMRKYY